MRVVKILLSLGVVLCLFLVEEDGISAPAIVTSDEAQAPIITNVKLKTKKILPGKTINSAF